MNRLTPPSRVPAEMILLTLFESRSATVAHVADIHFSGRMAPAKKALQRLRESGHAVSRCRSRSALVYSIAVPGIRTLAALGHLHSYPPLTLRQLARRAIASDLTLAHELAVMDVRAAFARAFRESVSEFTTWPAMSRFAAALPGEGERNVSPDGFLRLRFSSAQDDVFFLEVDRSTESLRVLVDRLRRYAAYQRSGAFAARCGGDTSEGWAFPFRVLVVVESDERRNNVAEALLLCFPPVLTLVWIGTRKQVLADPMSACWVCPADYRDATSAMPRPATGRGGWYRRDREREARIAALLRKRAIQGPDHRKGGPVAA